MPENGGLSPPNEADGSVAGLERQRPVLGGR
jgi:hypothetical protein